MLVRNDLQSVCSLIMCLGNNDWSKKVLNLSDDVSSIYQTNVIVPTDQNTYFCPQSRKLTKCHAFKCTKY